MKVLFLNHKEKNCGVYQYGYRVGNIISKSKIHSFIYHELTNENEYFDLILNEKPDGIIYNYHNLTLNWLNNNNMSKYPNIKHYKLCHENDGRNFRFNYFINDMYDRGNLSFYTVRPIFENLNFIYEKNEIPVIGSFGFGFVQKGFDRLCQIVNEQFDEAIIKLNIPFSFYGDPNGISSRNIAEKCRNKITKDKIKLEINHDFKTDYEVLEFLSLNTINVFLYDNLFGGGFSSVIDYAISVKRPIALTNSFMFRHIEEKSIRIENNSLQSIINNGSEVLDIYRENWSNDNLIKNYEDIIEKTII